MHGEHCGNIACLGCLESSGGLTAVGQDILGFSLHIVTKSQSPSGWKGSQEDFGSTCCSMRGLL